MAEDPIGFSKDGRRLHAGNFKPGQSGNPSGRPKADIRLAELAKERTEDALAVLYEIAMNKKAQPSARVNAASAILDRGWGKPALYVESRNLTATFTELMHLAKIRELKFQEVVKLHTGQDADENATISIDALKDINARMQESNGEDVTDVVATVDIDASAERVGLLDWDRLI